MLMKMVGKDGRLRKSVSFLKVKHHFLLLVASLGTKPSSADAILSWGATVSQDH